MEKMRIQHDTQSEVMHLHHEILEEMAFSSFDYTRVSLIFKYTTE